MLSIELKEKNVLYVSIAHKIIRHPNTQYIIYILQYDYPDVHQSPYMELFNLMIYIYIFSVTITFDS